MENIVSSDDGVSEVFGVMLLLTITIIVACIVSVFAGGFSFSSSEDTISSNIAASDFHVPGGSDDYTYVVFDLISGDPVSLNGITVKLGVRSSEKETTVISNSDNPSGNGLDDYMESYGDKKSRITVGGRFILYADGTDDDGVYWKSEGSLNRFHVDSDDFLTYRIIDDSTGRPVSSGMIAVPAV
ncbi:type IV pilin [Methanomicrobium sp. W14]|uniref:type IV pilin n=1 Tax=Methanomicrobium sp. W14 TaxID=2817839 RepID=UPI001FD97DF1|nr:type IV pilin N-terminal domain-containing protein [Methanomicrobium sp. W14]